MLYKYKKEIKFFLDIRVLRILIFGFSSRLTILLIFFNLSLWLKSAGIDKSTITLFSWAGIAYSFKFVWVPIIDSVLLFALTGVLDKNEVYLLLIIIADNLSGGLATVIFVAFLSNLN